MGAYAPPLEYVFDAVIAKWEGICRGDRPDGGTKDCAFCELFYHQLLRCEGCPIHRDTGNITCIGSPYENWENLLSFDNDDLFYADTPQRKKRARKMFSYLKRLKDQYYGKGVSNDGYGNG